MYKRIFMLVAVSLLFIGVASAAQPKILEANDNLGHRCAFDSIPEDSETKTFDWGACRITDEGIIMTVDEEIPVTEDTKISLCINKIKKEEGDTIEHKSSFLYHDHPSDIRDWTDEVCNTWELNQSYYTKDWSFRWYLKNQDDIAYHNPSVGSDSRFDVSYENLVLNESEEGTEIVEYDTVQINKNEYNRLKNQSEQEAGESDESTTAHVNATNVTGEFLGMDGEPITPEEPSREELQSQLEQKEERIQTLQERITELENRIQELTSESESANESRGREDVPDSQGQQNVPGNENAEENRPGFVNSLFSSIFG